MSLQASRSRVRAPERSDLTLDAAVTGMAFLDSGVLAVAGGDGVVRFVPQAGAPISIHAHDPDAAALALALDIDGESVLTGGDDGRLIRTSADGSISVLVEAPGRQIDTIAVSRVGGVRAAGLGREIRLIDRAGRVVGSTADHPTTVTGLAFNPKGKRLGASHYGGVTLWWVGSFGRSPKRLDWKGSHIGTSWSPDGSTIMTATQEANLHGWRLTDGQHMQMNGYSAKVRSMDWLAKPMTLVTAGADCVIAWGFTGGGPMGKPPMEIGGGIGQTVAAVAVNPRQPLVAAGFDDGRIAVCALNDERVVRLRPGDGARISALAWSPDGARLAAGTDDGAVAIFDLERAG
jgi:WD40 repeat protein